MQTTIVELIPGRIYVMAATHWHFWQFRSKYPGRYKDIVYLPNDVNKIRGLGRCTILRLDGWSNTKQYDDEFMYWLNHRRSYGAEILDIAE